MRGSEGGAQILNYDGDDQLDESSPIPETPDGHVYRVWGHEAPSLRAAMSWANAMPWGPVRWTSPNGKATSDNGS